MSLFRTWTGQSNKSHQSQQPQQLSPTLSKASSTKPPLQQSQSQSSSRGAQTDPWAGHLNHLSASQEEALGKFKSILYDQALYTPASSASAPSHDDATLLRFLRARKFDVNGALGQFKDTEKWRIENKIDDLYRSFDVDFYEKARTMYPQWTGRRDRRGIPVYVYVIRHLDSKNVNQYTKDSAKMKASSTTHSASKVPSKLLPLFTLYENMLNFVLPLCETLERPNPECPATNCTNIVDISGVGLKHFWNLKGHMQEASTLATAHYPETLDRIFIIGAPSFFPTVWGWIKRWFDPVTVSKIFILSQSEVKPTLEKFVDPANFPIEYGGKLDWRFGQHPNLDEAASAQCNKSAEGWVKGPVVWRGNQRVPVGTVDGKPRTADLNEEPIVQTNGHAIVVKDETPNGHATEPIKGSTPYTASEAPMPAIQSAEEPPVATTSVPRDVPSPDEKMPAVNGEQESSKDVLANHDKAAQETKATANDTSGEHTNGIIKPPIERFETALEELPKANGVVAS